jgi:MoxR-like ATPase
VGVPGLAKTLLIHTVARVMDLKFARIQFTPDLMPSDITGTDIINEDPGSGRRTMVFAPGPIFNNIVLADEVNRTPPKTQSALLEAMQEHRVTVQGRTYELEEPFYVFATQNPIELEGTYPLPEAQLDRFMFEIMLEHLPEEDELSVVRRTTAVQRPELNRAVSREDLIAFQELVRKVPISEPVLRYAVSLARASRPNPNGSLDFVKEYVAYGSSVRGAQNLILSAKARALTRGRYHVTFEDIQALAKPVLRHRILTNFHAEAEGWPRRRWWTVCWRPSPSRSRGSEEPTMRRGGSGAAGAPLAGAQFVDPKVLARISNLELLARTVVDGFISGLHRAPTWARRWTSPSTAPTCPGTTCAAWTGACTPGPTGTTSSSSRRTPTPTSWS